MGDRREKSFFAPLMLMGGLLLLPVVVGAFVPLLKCSNCHGTGIRSQYYSSFSECWDCDGRGKVPIGSHRNWSRR